jgi:hypothetical protein
MTIEETGSADEPNGNADQASDRGEYDVGYGKPPKASRFKPGKSGNPKGRRKGSKNIKTFLREELDRKQWVNVGGKRRHLTMRQILVLQQLQKAQKGDPKAFRAIMQEDEALADETASQAERCDMTPDEHEILAGHLRYLRTKDH